MVTVNQLRRLLAIAAMSFALFAAAPAVAHTATERYIPLGQSPGVSYKVTLVGKIEAVDPRRRSITVVAPSGTVVVEIGNKTRIWVDRTKSKLTNLDGNFIDLQAGRTVEVKFLDRDRRQMADWIKVEVSPLR